MWYSPNAEVCQLPNYFARCLPNNELTDTHMRLLTESQMFVNAIGKIFAPSRQDTKMDHYCDTGISAIVFLVGLMSCPYLLTMKRKKPKRKDYGGWLSLNQSRRR